MPPDICLSCKCTHGVFPTSDFKLTNSRQTETIVIASYIVRSRWRDMHFARDPADSQCLTAKALLFSCSAAFLGSVASLTSVASAVCALKHISARAHALDTSRFGSNNRSASSYQLVFLAKSLQIVEIH